MGKIDDIFSGHVEPNEKEKKLLEKYDLVIEYPKNMRYLEEKKAEVLAEAVIKMIGPEKAYMLAEYLKTHD